jgi:hypothetical protein
MGFPVEKSIRYTNLEIDLKLCEPKRDLDSELMVLAVSIESVSGRSGWVGMLSIKGRVEISVGARSMLLYMKTAT